LFPERVGLRLPSNRPAAAISGWMRHRPGVGTPFHGCAVAPRAARSTGKGCAKVVFFNASGSKINSRMIAGKGWPRTSVTAACAIVVSPPEYLNCKPGTRSTMIGKLLAGGVPFSI
jgi:hypothetical protein